MSQGTRVGSQGSLNKLGTILKSFSCPYLIFLGIALCQLISESPQGLRQGDEAAKRLHNRLCSESSETVSSRNRFAMARGST